MIESGEVVVLDVGILVGEIFDMFINGVDIVIMDILVICYMFDVIEVFYRFVMLGEVDYGSIYWLGGFFCLVGDVIGDYMWLSFFLVG